MTGAGWPRVIRNRWDQVVAPMLSRWRPTMPVSIIIPAFDCQETLSLTLASLSVQTYPHELLEVIVVDDGSEVPVELPRVVPPNCRVVPVPNQSGNWGRANALHLGATSSTGEILHWLDADMVLFPEHVEALARWHHVVPYAVALGYKRFARTGSSSPDEVVRLSRAGSLDQLFSVEDTEPHDYVEELIRDTHMLRAGDHLSFRAHVGATASLRRDLYLATGGFDTVLKLGEDTELGFRLAQAGALFIPDAQARSWHLGESNMMRRGEQLRRYNGPFLADRMPYPRWLRDVDGRVWRIPLVTVVIDASGASFELVRACVDRILANDEKDVVVKLVGGWHQVNDHRCSILDDPALDPRLIAAYYASEPRVSLINSSPTSVYPSPFRLDVPARVGLAPDSVRLLVEEADSWGAGLVRVVLPWRSDLTVDLWRTAAVGRAKLVRHTDERLEEVVKEVYGLRWMSGTDVGVMNLRAIPVADLRSPRPWRFTRPDDGRRSEPPANDSHPYAVPVAGVRSLGRAALFVARLAADRFSRAVRRRRPGSRNPSRSRRESRTG